MSNWFLNTFTELASTASCDKLFHLLMTRTETAVYHDGGSCFGHLSVAGYFQLRPAAASCRPISHSRCSQLRRLRMLSLHVDSTTATPCCTVLPIHYSGGCVVHTERCCPPVHGYTATGSHHSGFEGPPLATAVRRRVDYKLPLLVYKSLHGLAPPYLADDCILASFL